MVWWLYCENCQVWVEATQCTAESSELRVFVHEDNLPVVPDPDDGTVFTFDDVCWSVNPAGTRVCLPKGADVFTVDPTGAYFEDCAECETDPGENNPGENPGQGGGGGGGGGVDDDGGAPGGEPTEGETCGVEATICTAHAPFYDGDDVYVPCDQLPGEVTYFRLFGFCFIIDPGGAQVEPIPEGAVVVRAGGSFEDCEGCAFGVRATLCEGQANEDDAPEIWVRKPDLPESTIGFMWASWCYELDPDGFLELLPFDAFVLNPTDDFGDCTGCRQGVQAVVCPGQPEPDHGELWVEAQELTPYDGTLYFRFRGFCYSVDADATPTDITEGALIIVPRDECPDCATCLCGDCGEVADDGYKANACANQDTGGAEDVWILAADAPATLTHFLYNGVCYWVDPNSTPREIPHGASITRIGNVYENCFDCTTSGGGGGGGGNPGGGGGGGGGDGGGFPPFLPPGWPAPPERFLQLEDCETAQATNKWVRENHLCGVFAVAPCDMENLVVKLALPDGGCYKLINPQPAHGGQLVTAQVENVFNSCELCEPDPLCEDCEGDPCTYCECAPEEWTAVLAGFDASACFDCDEGFNSRRLHLFIDGAHVLGQIGTGGTGSCAWTKTITDGAKLRYYNFEPDAEAACVADTSFTTETPYDVTLTLTKTNATTFNLAMAVVGMPDAATNSINVTVDASVCDGLLIFAVDSDCEDVREIGDGTVICTPCS